MYGLDLFSGIGGITKALAGYVRPVAYCENDRYAQAVLFSRMSTGDIPAAPIWDDVKTLRGDYLPLIDIIYGGFPCQDISVAGRGAGLEGKRSGLFFEIARLVGELRPRFIFLENVPAIARRGGDTVVGTLADLGYDCRWDVLSAADVGANHLRERWWLMAYASERNGIDLSRIRRALERQARRGIVGDQGVEENNMADTNGGTVPQPKREAQGRNESGSDGEDVAHAEGRGQPVCRRPPGDPGHATFGGQDVADTPSARLQAGQRGTGGPLRDEARRSEPDGRGSHVADSTRQRVEGDRAARIQVAEVSVGERLPGRDRSGPGAGHWAVEPNVGRVANGIPKRVDRLRGLGNAVVPAQAREAFERLMGLK